MPIGLDYWVGLRSEAMRNVGARAELEMDDSLDAPCLCEPTLDDLQSPSDLKVCAITELHPPATEIKYIVTIAIIPAAYRPYSHQPSHSEILVVVQIWIRSCW